MATLIQIAYVGLYCAGFATIHVDAKGYNLQSGFFCPSGAPMGEAKVGDMLDHDGVMVRITEFRRF